MIRLILLFLLCAVSAHAKPKAPQPETEEQRVQRQCPGYMVTCTTTPKGFTHCACTLVRKG